MKKISEIAESPLQEKPLESFDEIELDEQEREAALRQARREKHFRLERKRYEESLIKPFDPPKYTAEQLLTHLAELKLEDGNLFRLDDDNREAVTLLCYYFTNDPRFEGPDRSLKKGLLLHGGVGVGKSVIMHLFQQNQKLSYKLVSCIDVVNEFTNQSHDERKAGVNPLSIFCGDAHAPIGGNMYGHRRLGLCFDDLGLENARAIHYGEVKNCMEEILWQRYKTGEHAKTHATTNMSAEQIEQTYGIRIRDRMKEMFNVIAWPVEAKSRRA